MSGYGPKYRKARPHVLADALYQCEVRGPTCTGMATTVDHVRPVAEGGTDDRVNLRAACPQCNSRLGGQLGQQRKRLRDMGTRSRRW
jgi:5-methylcytosine-specific restriction endonuclease McrA